jgi:hypothetical protein
LHIYEFNIELNSINWETELEETGTAYYHLSHKKKFNKDTFFKHVQTAYQKTKDSHPERLLHVTDDTPLCIETSEILETMCELFGYENTQFACRIDLVENEVYNEDDDYLGWDLEESSIDMDNIEEDVFSIEDEEEFDEDDD